MSAGPQYSDERSEPETAQIKVVVRVRPLLQDEIFQGKTQHRLLLDNKITGGAYQRVLLYPIASSASQYSQQLSSANTARAFKFDKVFGPDTSQERMFTNLGCDLLVTKVLEVSLLLVQHQSYVKLIVLFKLGLQLNDHGVRVDRLG